MTEGTTEVSRGLRTRAGLLMQLAQIAENLADAQDSLAQLEDRKNAVLKALGQESGGVILPPPIVTVAPPAPTTAEDPSRESLFRVDIQSMVQTSAIRAKDIFARLQGKYATVEPKKVRSQVGFLLTRMVREGKLARVNRGVYGMAGMKTIRPLGGRATGLLDWIRTQKSVRYADIAAWFEAAPNPGKSPAGALAGNACSVLLRRGEIKRVARGRYRAV